MPDWDGDGKQDWHDDYVYHEVFRTKKAVPQPRRSEWEGHWRALVIGVGIALIWGLLNLIAALVE